MKSNRLLAGIVFLLATACLVITTLMTRQSGVSQAATEQGQSYLGWASIIIHLGLPVFGIAAGTLTRAGNKIAAGICMVFVVLCALFSLNNIMSFVASERFSITQARDATAKAKAARETAAIKAAEKRQSDQTALVQQQLKWLQGTAKEADGRRERKDSIEQGNKLIQDFGKTEVPVAQGSIDNSVTIRPDAGVQMIAEFTGWSVSVLQLSNVLQICAMLLLFESVLWSVGAYLWAAVPLAPAAPLPLPSDPAPLSGGNKGQRLLTAPSRPEPKIITVRTEPTAEWRSLLDRIDYPPNGSRHRGPLRPRLEPDIQALRLLCFMGAYDERGDYSSAALEDVYADFLGADHREETASRLVKPALEAIRGKVASKRWVSGAGTTWHIQPPPIDKMQSLLERAKIIAPTSTLEPDKPEPEAPKQEAAGEKTAGSIIPFLWKGRQAGNLH